MLRYGMHDMSTFENGLSVAESVQYNADLGGNTIRTAVSGIVLDAVWPSSGAPIDWRAEPKFTAFMDGWNDLNIEIMVLVPGGPTWMGIGPWNLNAAERIQVADLYSKLYETWPNVRIVEILNEPNLQFFWPTPNPTTAAQVVDGIATRLQENLGSVLTVIGPALSPITTTSGALGQEFSTYLGTFLTAGGANHLDGLSFHPYPSTGLYGVGSGSDPLASGSFWYGTTASIYSASIVLDLNGFPALPLWLTEIGISTTANGGYQWVEADQADYLKLMHDYCSQHPRIEGYNIHTLYQASATADHGMIESGTKRKKPAYYALQDIWDVSPYGT